MELWIGKDAAFSVEIVLLITVYLYLMGMRQSVFMARSSAGLYRQDRWFAIGEAVLNLVLSLIFIQFWGVDWNCSGKYYQPACHSLLDAAAHRLPICAGRILAPDIICSTSSMLPPHWFRVRLRT